MAAESTQLPKRLVNVSGRSAPPRYAILAIPVRRFCAGCKITRDQRLPMVRHRLRHKEHLRPQPRFSQIGHARRLLLAIKMRRAGRGLTCIRGCRAAG